MLRLKNCFTLDIYCILAERHIDRQAAIQKDSYADIQPCIQPAIQSDSHTDRQPNKQTDKQHASSQ